MQKTQARKPRQLPGSEEGQNLSELAVRGWCENGISEGSPFTKEDDHGSRS
jgi:hypothetical protein